MSAGCSSQSDIIILLLADEENYPMTKLDSIIDILSPYLDQKGRCSLGATSRSLRNAVLDSEAVCYKVEAQNLVTMEKVESFDEWVQKRIHAVRHLGYSELQFPLLSPNRRRFCHRLVPPCTSPLLTTAPPTSLCVVCRNTR